MATSPGRKWSNSNWTLFAQFLQLQQLRLRIWRYICVIFKYLVVFWCCWLGRKWGHFIHSFISGMHHYECVAPNVDIILQNRRFWATSIASFREMFNDSRCCWVALGRSGGLLQFSKGKLLRSAWHLIGLAFVQCGRTGRDAVLEQ